MNNTTTIQEINLFDTDVNIYQSTNTSNMKHKQIYHQYDEACTPHSQEKHSTTIKKTAS